MEERSKSLQRARHALRMHAPARLLVYWLAAGMFWQQSLLEPEVQSLQVISLYALAYPILALIVAESLPDPRRGITWLFGLDGFNAGIGLATLGYALIPTLFLAGVTLTNMLTHIGLRGLALQTLIIAGSSMLAAAWLPQAMRANNPELHLFAALGLAVYALMVGFNTHIFVERLRKLSRKLRSQSELLENQSRTDTLTGLHNRRHLYRWMQERSSRIQAYVLIDLDHFKAINDQYGHDAGDRALTVAAQTLRSLFPPPHQLVRWGGEEFLLVFVSEHDLDLAPMLSKILENLASTPVVLEDGQSIRITCSCGAMEADESMDWQQAIRLADQALYRAKQTGRHRAVYLYPGPLGREQELSLPLAQLLESGQLRANEITSVVEPARQSLAQTHQLASA